MGRTLAVALALSLASVPSFALAQTAPEAPPNPAAAPATTAAPSPAPMSPAPPVVVTEKARRHFLAGVLLLEDPARPRYEEAYREFKTAYADSPSYKILGNLGLCAMKLERDEEAIEAYERYLRDGGSDIDAQERAQVERDLTTLRSGITRVDVLSTPPGGLLNDVRIPVDGTPITNAYGPLRADTIHLALRQGHHRITAHLPGFPDLVWEFDAGAGDSTEHTFAFQKPPPPRITVVPTRHVRPVPVGVYVGAGVTGAFLIGGTVTGILALHQQDLFQQDNTGLRKSQAQDDANAGKTLNIVTDCLFGAAILSAGVTTYLYLARPGHDEPLRAGAGPKPGPRLDVVPTASRGVGPGLAVVGAF